ncbi:hypothetical protein KAW65_01885 [candidate division WOR-3 bacterium]|nr:hypothetical protein [candidate division WOR-3 bacterium]
MKGKIPFVFTLCTLHFALLSSLCAQEITPPTDVKVFDTPNDAGNSITIKWKLSSQDSLLDGYEIHRSQDPVGEFIKIGWSIRGINTYTDEEIMYKGKILHEVKNKTEYYYKICGKFDTEFTSFSEVAGPTISSPQLFNKSKINVLIGVMALLISFLGFIRIAKRGGRLFIRKIAGLEALDEAVGRATEMGRPVLYVPGLSTISDIATIASLNIMGRVAKKTAEYGIPLLVPNRDPIVLTVAKQVVKEAYLAVGRPDVFKDEDVSFISSSQFAYAAGVAGIMAREKPGTNLFIGMFWAESLVLAETGAATGAIQIAGTDAMTQLPFFVTTCDYTIMGEELYAASAYLSKEPILVGSIKAQDLLKAIILTAMIVGTILMMLGSNVIANLFKV